LQRNVSKNAEYAKKKGIRFLVVIGENEKKKGTVTVKDLKENKQFEVKNNPTELQKLVAIFRQPF
jgi:histidyl-tRNA synthetase